MDRKMIVDINVEQKSRLIVPEMLFISVTGACGQGCSFCANAAYLPSVSLERPLVDRIISEARGLGVSTIAIVGGEPLLHSEIFDILENTAGMNVMLFTNGLLIDRGIVLQLARQAQVTTIINLSAGAGSTGPLSPPDRVCGLLAEVGARWGVALVAQKSALANILSATSPFMELGVQGCSVGFILDYLPVGPQAQDREVLHPHDRERILEFSRTISQQCFPCYFLPHAEGGACLGGGRGLLHIAPDGAIEPCPFIHDARHNIRSTTIKQAIQSSFMADFRGQGGRSHIDCPCPHVERSRRGNG